MCGVKDNEICNLKNKIKELEKQLAEKEKEIEKQNRRISLLEKYKNDQKTRANEYYKQYKQANQDKISFAVEQLEKVKAEFVNNVSPVNLSYTEYVQEVFNKLNNQIEELKKEMK